MEMLRLVLRVAPEYLIVALVKAGGAREERKDGKARVTIAISSGYL